MINSHSGFHRVLVKYNRLAVVLCGKFFETLIQHSAIRVILTGESLHGKPTV